MAAQMGLFETTESEVPFVAPSTVDEPDPPVKPEAELRAKQPEPKPVEPPRSTAPRDQPDASSSWITEKPLGERRLSTRKIWGAISQGAYQRTIETVYYVVSANETSTGLSQDTLPSRPCSCGQRRFIANINDVHHWRCMRCYPPGNNEHILIHDVPNPEECVPY